ncbi:ABC transporter permease [Streptococcus marimammalium]|uniref:ABC transporter permease n=1 Tax=Streptococcus marimammalium TaxID=269666 RepID=UPI000374F905|nr:ABC transporter permease [Streptococcus marimammalium]
MKKLARNSFRAIKKNWPRLLSVTILIVLSNFVFIGLFSTGPNMRETILNTYQKENLADAIVFSSTNLANDDKKELSQSPLIKSIEYGKQIDAKLKNKVIRLISTPEKISKLNLIEGRLPIEENEIAIGKQLNYKVGDVLKITSDDLKSNTFKIVGIVKSSEYMSKRSLGITSLADGNIHYFGVINKNLFKNEDNFARIIFKNTYNKEAYTKEYTKLIEKNISSLQHITQQQTIRLRQQFTQEIDEKIKKIDLNFDDLMLSKQSLNEMIKQIEKVGNQNPVNLDQNEYIQQKNELKTQVKQISKQINELKRQKITLENLKKQQSFLLITVEDRSQFSVGYSDYGNTAIRIDILASILPIIFFVISLMVSITTMKRMVDEKRIEMGTLRSLGFTKSEVMREFLIFSTLTSVLGSLLGCFLGIHLLPKMIFNIFSNGNYILDEMIIVYQWPILLISFFLSLSSTFLAVYLSAKKQLKEHPSQLIYTKPPQKKNGIFLEYFPKLWHSISFSNKLTLRNSFRYKSRLLMTILGVMLSTSLLILGIGIKDSLSQLVPIQYQSISKYDAIEIFNPYSLEIKDFQKKITNFSKQKKEIVFKNLTIHNHYFIEPQSVQLFVANDFYDYVNLDSQPTKNGVVVSKKLAQSLHLEKGDSLIIKDKEGYSKTLKISDTTTNYIGHIIYMTPNYYETIFNEPYQENAYLIKTQKSFDTFLKQISNNKVHMYTIRNTTLKQEANDFLEGLNGIIIIIVVISILLVFIVLFTLTSINVAEREKELSTIKVLGFYQKEVLLYIFKETILLTFIGILLGIGLGYFLHAFIMAILLPENLIAIEGLTWSNIIVSVSTVFSFTIIVMFIMNLHIKKIDMLSALKSV